MPGGNTQVATHLSRVSACLSSCIDEAGASLNRGLQDCGAMLLDVAPVLTADWARRQALQVSFVERGNDYGRSTYCLLLSDLLSETPLNG